MKKLSGYAALVTGASGTLGSEIARMLAAQGACVMLHYHTGREQAEEIARRLREADGSVDTCGADITSETEVRELVNRCVERFGGLDILVANAGITADGLLLQMSLDQWNKVIATNLTGTFLCCKYALRVMLRARYGRIIGISSIAGSMGNAGQANYAAAKAGLTGLILSVAQEYSRRGICANVVSPGLIESKLIEHLPSKVIENKMELSLLNRMGTPAEVAAVAAFLASPEASYINGSEIRVDGGIRF